MKGDRKVSITNTRPKFIAGGASTTDTDTFTSLNKMDVVTAEYKDGKLQTKT